jgi:hypothetical protein
MKSVSVKMKENEIDRIVLLKECLIDETGLDVSRHAVIKRMMRVGYNVMVRELKDPRLDRWEKTL